MNTMYTLLFGLFTSIITVAAGKGLDVWWSKRGDDRKLHFLAIKLMFVFEGYGEACLDELIEIDNCNDYDGQAHTGKTPAFPEFPTGDDYRHFDHELLVQILDFPINRSASINSMSSLFFCDHDEMAEAMEQHLMRLGIMSFELAEKIRATYSLPITRQSKSLEILIKRQEEFNEKKLDEYLNRH